MLKNKKGNVGAESVGVLGTIAVGIVILAISLVIAFLVMGAAKNGAGVINTGLSESYTTANTTHVYTLTTQGVMPSTFSAIFPSAKVTKGGTANAVDSNEGEFVSADNTYGATDKIITATTLQGLTAGMVSGANGIWAGDTTEGVWDDVGTLASFVDAGDTHITTETLYAANGETTTTLYFTSLDGIAKGDALTVETGTTDTDVTVTGINYATKALTITAANFSANKAALLTTAKMKTNAATTATANGDADLAATGAKTITVSAIDGLAVGDIILFTCSVGTAAATIVTIPSTSITTTISASDCSDQTSVNVSMTTPYKANGATLTGVATIPIRALTNAKVSILSGGTANVANTYEGVYVSSDNTLSTGDTIVRGETLEALTGGHTLSALHYTLAYDTDGFIDTIKLSTAGNAIYINQNLTLSFSESGYANQGIDSLTAQVATIPSWIGLIIIAMVGAILLGIIKLYYNRER